MYSEVRYEHADFPKYDSDKGQKLAEELYEWYRHEKDCRMQLEQVLWPACDDAYQCIRKLPRNRAMVWADKSDLGETDLKDMVDFLVDAVMVSLMGRDGSWFAPVSYVPEDQAIQNLVRDYLTARHRDAGTRDEIGIHLNQVFRRGTGAYTLEWKKIYRMKRYDPAESKVLLNAAATQVMQMGIDPTPVMDQLSKQMKRERKMELAYSGPVVRPLDMYDVILDSTADLRRDADQPICTVVYKTVEELKNAVDEQGEKMYDNLEDLKEWSPQEIYDMNPMRYRSLQALGVNPLMDNARGSSFVPVLIFHRMVQGLDGSDDKWVDSFFHVALGSSKSPRLIRAEENPSDYGHRDIFIDTYRDWCNTAYGVGVVEKSIGDWQKKNIASALTLNAMLVEVFPPLAVLSDMLVDDRRIDVAPGGMNIINYKPGVLTNFVAPLPIAIGGAERGMTYQRYLGQKILGQGGAYGAIMQDPTKSIFTAKTATQINTESSSGTTTQQNFLEKLSKSLEPFCQKFYDDCRQYEEDEVLSFISDVQGGDPAMKQLDKSVLDKDRRIVVTGYHGVQNQAQEMQNMKDALQILTTGNAAEVLQNAPLIIQDVVFTLLGDLGMKNLDKYRQPALELLISQPQVQQQIQAILAQLAQAGVPQQILVLLAQVFTPPQAGAAPGAPPQSPQQQPPGGGGVSPPPPQQQPQQQSHPQPPHPMMQGGQQVA